ncbi:sugar transferase [Lunatibacter salilacus]|uniref:sugar transferase n=1 Tax=Lunatibacter salilacus TaxID=2483804 RepID=UPI00131B3D57|nr:sugar transferase [Lunatibacter salilacus]
MENVLVKRESGKFYSKDEKIKRDLAYAWGSWEKEAAKRIGKRGLDLFVSILALVLVMSWLFPLLAILIKLDSKGPVLFKQLRHGLDNKPFYCYKFRTMVANEEADSKQATINDKRITKIGKFLRISSIDELPQIFNVIKGDMAIVGPRPHTMPMNLEFAKSIDNFMSRHAVKPGITGLAQSKGFRGEVNDFIDIYGRFRLDVFYVEKWCLLLDLKIILLTMKMLLGKNPKAY